MVSNKGFEKLGEGAVPLTTLKKSHFYFISPFFGLILWYCMHFVMVKFINCNTGFPAAWYFFKCFEIEVFRKNYFSLICF